MTTIRPGTADDIKTLICIWLDSVRKTHLFLTEHDIAALLPQVRQGMEELDLWVAEVDSVPAGFMLVDGDTVEALFIAPERQGKGVGTALLEQAKQLRNHRGWLRVDVNEQNPDAHGFYLSRGFKPVGRSDTDRQGRPFPLLHLALDLG